MSIKEQIEIARALEYITAEQLALLTQLDPQTIYRKAKKGIIPAVYFGRRLRFHRVIAITALKRPAAAI